MALSGSLQDLPKKGSVDGNDLFPCFDVIGGREACAQAKTLKEYINRELLERVARLIGSTDTIFARIQTLETTTATQNETVAKSVRTLESQMLGTEFSRLGARVEEVELTYASKTYAEAKKLEAVEASVAYTDDQIGGLAGVYTTQEAFASVSGYLSGKYTLKVTAGNVVTGMNITSSTGAGEDISSITFNAADFKIYNGTTAVPVFQASGGVVYMNAVQIGYSLISGGPSSDADNTHGAVASGLNINSGGVTLSGTALIKSSNYSAGSAGWAIKPDGTIDVYDGSFRGVINATSGSLGSFDLGSSFLETSPSYAGYLGIWSSSTGSYILAGDSRSGHGPNFELSAAALDWNDSSGVTSITMTASTGDITCRSIHCGELYVG
jgi:hypothetical protein